MPIVTRVSLASENCCESQRKLDSVLNKFIVKRRCQFVRPTVHVDTYAAIDNLLGQYGTPYSLASLTLVVTGKKLQLSESEVKQDIMVMKNGGKLELPEDGMQHPEMDTAEGSLSCAPEESKQSIFAAMEDEVSKGNSKSRRSCGGRNAGGRRNTSGRNDTTNLGKVHICLR